MGLPVTIKGFFVKFNSPYLVVILKDTSSNPSIGNASLSVPLKPVRESATLPPTSASNMFAVIIGE